MWLLVLTLKARAVSPYVFNVHCSHIIKFYNYIDNGVNVLRLILHILVIVFTECSKIVKHIYHLNVYEWHLLCLTLYVFIYSFMF